MRPGTIDARPAARTFASAATTAVACALLCLLLAAASTPASAAPTTSAYATYAGPSLRNAVVPAQPVQIAAFHSNPLTSVSFSVNGVRLGGSSTPSPAGSLYTVTATVDLTGLTGAQIMRIRYVLTTGAISAIEVPFTAVAPVVAPPTVEPAVPTPPPAPAPVPVTSTGPGEADTGVVASERLRPRAGNMVVTVAGSTVADLDISGCLVIRANNVLVRNVRVSCGTPQYSAAIQVISGYGGLVVEDSEIDGLGTAAVGVGYSGFLLRRVEIRNVNDGVRMSSNTTLESSWVHDMARQGDLHPDAVQSTGGTNIVIRGNTLAPQRADGDLANSAIQLGSETAPRLAGITIADNHLSGGSFSLNVRGDTVLEDAVVSGNVFGADSRYGPVQAPAALAVGPTNVLASTGAPVEVVIAG